MSAKRVARNFVAICALLASAQSIAGAETATGAAGASTVSVSTAQSGGVVEGPLEADRKLLLSRIDLAKRHGIGTAVYLTEFNKVEEEVKNGASADQIKGRVDSLTRSLAEQLQRGRNLKTQRPIPPSGSQLTGNNTPTASGTPSKSGWQSAATAGISTGNPAQDEKLKNAVNGLPPGTLEKLMQNDKVRNIIDKLK